MNKNPKTTLKTKKSVKMSENEEKVNENERKTKKPDKKKENVINNDENEEKVNKNEKKTKKKKENVINIDENEDAKIDEIVEGVILNEDEIKKEDEETMNKDDENEIKKENEDEDEENGPLFPEKMNISQIRNKNMRTKMFIAQKSEKRKERIKASKQKKKDGQNPDYVAGDKKIPHTIDSLREHDVTMITDDIDDEIDKEEATDSYAGYFTKSYQPKVLITHSDNPKGKTIKFVRELSQIIPNSKLLMRKRSRIEKVIKSATKQGYTDVVVVNEDRKVPNGLLVIHLPEGPTALFRMSNPKICKDIRRRSKDITAHRPEVILNNFKTRLGRVVARMLGALFHYEPEFKGRQVCTFHNQRDYIFFRHHRYEFKNTEKVKLRELGPRFTLKLQWLQEGAFEGDYEWVLKRHDMETSRRRFFL